MQSGISASPTLHSTFHTFLSDPALFALLITITSERLEPLTTIAYPASPSTSLSTLTPHLHPTRALYILLRPLSPPQNPESNHPTTTLTAITYIPDAAPVRQKTLFASTRLTLLRELGADKFSAHIFATEAADLSEEGWERWQRHEGGEVPLTREEGVLGEVRRMEGEEGRGMQERRAHVEQVGKRGLEIVLGEGVGEELRGLVGRGKGGKVVMLKIAPDESLVLASTEETDLTALTTKISDTEPRYSFFNYTHAADDGTEASSVVFIYTCPPGSKVKERMVYASFRRMVIGAASQAGGFEVAKKLEASSPSEITPDMIEEEFHPRQEQKQAFARPKRPGKN